MTEFAELLRRTQEAQASYYQALGRATVDYWRSMFDLLGVKLPTSLSGIGVRSSAAAPRPAGASAAAGPAVSLLLEAPAGSFAVGAFVISNKLPHSIAAPIDLSPFIAEDGAPIRPEVTLEPNTVLLEPSGQQIVQVSVKVGEDLELGKSYRARVSVPGLSETTIALLLRRQTTVAP